jgi:hypothetical protein
VTRRASRPLTGRAVRTLAALAALAVGALGCGEREQDTAPSLARGASRLAPATTGYVIEQGGTQIGFATSTIDTGAAGISVHDSIVTELPIGGKLNPVSARLRTELTRTLALRAFALDLESATGPLHVTGAPSGDTLLVLTVAASGSPPDTQRVAVRGPILLPTVVPLAVALGERPSIGRRYALTTFDPLSLAPREARLAVRAESLFVVPRGASGGGVDTVRAWHLVPETPGGFASWVAADGRVVRLEQPGGFVLRRAAPGVASWRARAGRTRQVPSDGDILESTAIAASAPLRNGLLSRLRVRVSNVALGGFEVVGERQTLHGDTLVVTRDTLAGGASGYTLPGAAAFRRTFARELAPEPLMQVDAPAIRDLARTLSAGSDDPRVVAERINRWVHDSLRKEITIGVPDALQVLAARNGDCNEHTQLYLAVARAAGVPARGAAGLARVGRKFYYHAWPEVYLGRWVAVDPTFGEFPADAGHLRFVTGGLGRQVELLRLIGTLQINVLDSR